MADAELEIAALEAQVKSLIVPLGWGDQVKISPMIGSGNNRVFEVQAPPRQGFLKVYFRDPSDQRDRLNAEFSFARFAWHHNLHWTAEPLAKDDEAGIALYEFIRGRPVTMILSPYVDQILKFFTDLNRYRSGLDAARLPAASEACFSVQGHLDLVSQRVSRLVLAPVTNDLEREMKTFVNSQLLPYWNSVLKVILARAKERAFDLTQELPEKDRCLSPSDFGFHNALLLKDGSLRFIDLEYAGWDDPAKVMGDLFCQPRVPIPENYYELAAKSISELFTQPDWHRWRFRLLRSVYQVKWCCIMLNEFLPVGGRRRQFSISKLDPEQRKRQQLAKATGFFASFEKKELAI